MAIKGVCSVIQVVRNNDDHSHFDIGLSYAALDDVQAQGTHYLYDLNPSLSGATLTSQIQSAMKTFLEGEGVNFGLLDSVRLLPGIV